MFFNNPLQSNMQICSEEKEECNLCGIVMFLQSQCPPLLSDSLPLNEESKIQMGQLI